MGVKVWPGQTAKSLGCSRFVFFFIFKFFFIFYFVLFGGRLFTKPTTSGRLSLSLSALSFSVAVGVFIFFKFYLIFVILFS